MQWKKLFVLAAMGIVGSTTAAELVWVLDLSSPSILTLVKSVPVPV
ncbi:MAG: hypothetical protein L6W00_21725 [Lentisphaeria bacterium]|nr:MAG: hypothetical protein L6W00_21725 [Lentisphaeria bacterium]